MGRYALWRPSVKTTRSVRDRREQRETCGQTRSLVLTGGFALGTPARTKRQGCALGDRREEGRPAVKFSRWWDTSENRVRRAARTTSGRDGLTGAAARLLLKQSVLMSGKRGLQLADRDRIIDVGIAHITAPNRKIGHGEQLPINYGSVGNQCAFYTANVAAWAGFRVGRQISFHLFRLYAHLMRLENAKA